jgi:hypothetical protein
MDIVDDDTHKISDLEKFKHDINAKERFQKQQMDQ